MDYADFADFKRKRAILCILVQTNSQPVILQYHNLMGCDISITSEKIVALKERTQSNRLRYRSPWRIGTIGMPSSNMSLVVSVSTKCKQTICTAHAKDGDFEVVM